MLFGEFLWEIGLKWIMSKVWSISRKLIRWANLSYASMVGIIRKRFSSKSTPISNKLLAWSVGAIHAMSA